MIKGVVKVMSKMGICTIDGYRGAQIFEALGLSSPWSTATSPARRRASAASGMDVIAEETLMRHRQAFAAARRGRETLDTGGQYQWRSDGEHHSFNPLTVHKLQMACRTGNYGVFQEYSALIE